MEEKVNQEKLKLLLKSKIYIGAELPDRMTLVESQNVLKFL